jgi:hypothetical protein
VHWCSLPRPCAPGALYGLPAASRPPLVPVACLPRGGADTGADVQNFLRMRPIGNFRHVLLAAHTEKGIAPMNEPARHYRCDVRDFVSDLMDLIKGQIGRAVDDPLDQFAATVAASGVVPVMRGRLVPEAKRLLDLIDIAQNEVLT